MENLLITCEESGRQPIERYFRTHICRHLAVKLDEGNVLIQVMHGDYVFVVDCHFFLFDCKW